MTLNATRFCKAANTTIKDIPIKSDTFMIYDSYFSLLSDQINPK